MALSAAAHRSSDKVAAGEKYDGLRAQKTDRAGEAANRALRRQKSNAAGDAVFFELFDEHITGVRPEALAEPRPQERVQRHTVEHIVDFVRFAPMVQILDAPVPQMVEQLPDVVHFFDTLTPDPEQVIEVPKILLDDVPVRTAVVTQLADQLVEVLTIISFSSLQRIVEQNVAIPVPGGGGRLAGLQGVLPGQSSTAPQFSEERISERFVEQIVDIPGGRLQVVRSGQSSSASSSSPAGVHQNADEPRERVFRTFPRPKKSAKITPASRVQGRMGTVAHPS